MSFLYNGEHIYTWTRFYLCKIINIGAFITKIQELLGTRLEAPSQVPFYSFQCSKEHSEGGMPNEIKPVSNRLDVNLLGKVKNKLP